VSVVTSTLLAEPPKRQHLEEDLQRAVVQFLRFALPANALFAHIPNGMWRHKRAAARLVGLGIRAGLPDLLVVHDGRAIFIELKAKGGSQSLIQKQMARRLAACGCEVFLCRSVDEVELVLRGVGIRLRGRVA